MSMDCKRNDRLIDILRHVRIVTAVLLLAPWLVIYANEAGLASLFVSTGWLVSDTD